MKYIATICILCAPVLYTPIYKVYKAINTPRIYTYTSEPIQTPLSMPTLQQGEFTAYTASTNETDSTPNINASGTTPKDGSIACPVKYAFGVRIKVEGKIYTCDDRMNKRYQNKNNFDLFIPEKSKALKYGRKMLTFEVLPPGDNLPLTKNEI